jgi:predicted signal transduction protein with EAL and GGDEF domain
MNLEVVAEGVETTDQMNFLLRRKCDQVQGFLFSKPVPVAEFTHAVKMIERPSYVSGSLRHDKEVAVMPRAISPPASVSRTSGMMRAMAE